MGTTTFLLVALIPILQGVAFRYCLSLKAQKKGTCCLKIPLVENLAMPMEMGAWRFGKERRSFKWRWVSWVWFFCFVFLLGVNFN